MTILKKEIFQRFLIYFILGLIFSLSFEPFNIPIMQIISIFTVGYIWVKKEESFFLSFLFGFLYGFSNNLVTFSWIINPFKVYSNYSETLPLLALFSLAFFLSLSMGLAFGLASKLGKKRRKIIKIIYLSIFITFADLSKSEYGFDFPWAIISSSWIDTYFIQNISFFGPYWLTFFIVFSSLSLSLYNYISLFGVSILLFLLCSGYIYNKNVGSNSFENFDIRLVQPNIKQSEKWKIENKEIFLKKLITLSSSKNLPDLIIWPETAVQFLPKKGHEELRKISSFLPTNILFGARRVVSKEKKIYNSAFLINKNGEIISFYDKFQLVPFGEYVPFGRFLNKFSLLNEDTDFPLGFSKGEKENIINIKGIPPFFIQICYESIFTNFVNSLINDTQKNRPKWIVNLTNDAWFGNFNGPHQHLTQTRMRAIERGIPIIRVANTGFSAVINHKGEITRFLDLNIEGVIDTKLPSSTNYTLYSKLGSNKVNFTLIIFMLSIILILSIKYIFKIFKE